MLRPRKNPLIDGPLVVSAGRRLRRWQILSFSLMAVVVGLVIMWPSAHPTRGEVSDEVWWRRLISSIALKRLVQDVDASAADQMKQRLTELESERVSLTERLAEADKLLKIDRSQQRLSQVVARREDGEITFEILLRTPPGGSPGTRLSIDVMAVRNPASPPGIARASTLALDIDRSTRLAVASPKVAETLQGKLTSAGSHLLVMLSPAGDASQTEALLVPVNGSR